MKAISLDDLVLLPEPVALARHFDARNWRVVRWLLPFLFLMSLISVVAVISAGILWGIVFYGANLAFTLGIFAARKEEWFARHFRRILIVYLLFQFLLWKSWVVRASPGEEASSGFLVFLAFLIVFLRLRVSEFLLLYGVLGVLSCLRIDPSAPPQGWLLGAFDPEQTIPALVACACALLWTRAEKRRFLDSFRRESSRSRERIRMREEIGYARRIQLSMLPQRPPAVDWLEVAAVSLPATEVGGDYYDYFVLSPSRVVLGIGDVAGHGVASGLLLSGLRSCLYLLEKDLAEPVRVLARLSPMVRRTTGKRMFVTLLLAVLDREEGTLTVASAGHPPLLHARGGRLQEVGKGAPPLGTFKDARFEAEARTLAPGDLLVLYSDGLVEALDGEGREYGRERLERVVAQVENGRSPLSIREAILSDLAAFRGNVESADDVTVVVVRVGAGGSGRRQGQDPEA
ncbi:MAG TPA: PP2C family protein-serine/threonine phosphatase [Thermoanaerobaculia bacterium]|nr:PP2C family protein-serine/threonine phosphatase [Thermoanaerobaculia bacterium]